MQNRIKLFVDSHVFDYPFQGTRTYIAELYKELIRKNPDITFFFGAYDTGNLKNEFGEQDNVRYIKYFTRNKFIRLVLIIPFNILKYRINLSHFQYVLPLLKLSKEILTIHDVLFIDFPALFPSGYRWRNKLLFRLSAKRADFLLTVSEYSRQKISEHFNINIDDIHVLANGVSNDFFDHNRILPDVKSKFGLDRYILYVSRIEPRKNHLLLLKAYVELGLWKEGIKLVFIGSKTLRSDIFDKYISEIPEEIKKSLVLIDNSYGDELKSFYRNCSLFVYPSLAEGFGIPPLEAIASKVPVLCSRTTAMCDFGFLKERLFDPESIDELKKKMLIAINDAKRDYTSDIEFIKSRYSWENSASLFKSIILKNIPGD